MLFTSYVRITNVEVTFYAGLGFEAPIYEVGVVPFENRLNDLVTTNVPIIVGQSTESAIGGDIPDLESLDTEDVQDGRAKFVSRAIPSFTGLPFWESYGMEWQLRFPRTGTTQSMGIASIVVTVDAIIDAPSNTELIGIRERKYYRSVGSVPAGLNPERYLAEQDSATVYWRSASVGSFSGHNRHRTYAWGEGLIDDNSDQIQSSDVAFLESLQEEEYNKARDLLSSPYQYTFTGFTPLDERTWLSLLGEGVPSPTRS
jgi:hypothetical protein